MQVAPDSLRSQHTLYQARYRSERGLRLQQQPFSEYSGLLLHRSDYAETQALGSALREAGIDAFEYRSARDPEQGINVALFSPQALQSKQAEHPQAWLCMTTPKEVVFSYRGRPSVLYRYSITDFLVDGVLPKPA